MIAKTGVILLATVLLILLFASPGFLAWDIADDSRSAGPMVAAAACDAAALVLAIFFRLSCSAMLSVFKASGKSIVAQFISGIDLDMSDAKPRHNSLGTLSKALTTVSFVAHLYSTVRWLALICAGMSVVSLGQILLARPFDTLVSLVSTPLTGTSLQMSHQLGIGLFVVGALSLMLPALVLLFGRASTVRGLDNDMDKFSSAIEGLFDDPKTLMQLASSTAIRNFNAARIREFLDAFDGKSDRQ